MRLPLSVGPPTIGRALLPSARLSSLRIHRPFHRYEIHRAEQCSAVRCSAVVLEQRGEHRMRDERGGMESRSRSQVRYKALSSREDGKDHELRYREKEERGEEDDLRFRFEMPDEVPCKSIVLALFLLSLGTFFLVISHFIFTEHMAGDSEQAYGFLVLGILVFLPGFYETRIAYYSWRGFSGYSFSRIPAY